jgi:hypothetical protein
VIKHRASSAHTFYCGVRDLQAELAADAIIQALRNSSSSISGAVAALQASDITVVYCKFDHCK